MKLHKTPSPQGILFDMDGVLLITNQSSAQSWREVSQQFAPVLNISVDTLVHAIQESRRAYKREIEHDEQKQRRDRLEPFETRQETVDRALKGLNREDRNISADIVRSYDAHRELHRQLAPHALELLRNLRKRGTPIALISNGNATYQRRKIAQHQLSAFFETILIEEEFGVAKPDQRIFLHALDALHISASEAWMIGDDLARDIAGSQQVGIFAIWCDFAKQGLPNTSTIRPDRVVHDLSEVSDMLSL